MNQIIRFPDDDAAAALLRCALPIAVPIDRKIGGNDVEFFAIRRSQQEGVSHTLFSDIADEDRFAAV